MNASGELTHTWGDGVHSFKLSVKGVIELEDKCDAPFAVIFTRLNAGTFKINDVRETIRLGLIGAGLDPSKAFRLVETYTMPLADSLPAARAILGAVMFGFEAHPLGKETAAATQESPSASTPPPLSEPPASLGSDRVSLEEFHSGSWWQ